MPICLDLWLTGSLPDATHTLAAAGCLGAFSLVPGLHPPRSRGGSGGSGGGALPTLVWRAANQAGRCGLVAPETAVYIFFDAEMHMWVVAAACPGSGKNGVPVLGCAPFILAASTPAQGAAVSSPHAAPDALRFLGDERGWGWAAPAIAHSVRGGVPLGVPKVRAECVRHGAPPSAADAAATVAARAAELVAKATAAVAVPCENVTLTGQPDSQPHDGCMGRFQLMWRPLLPLQQRRRGMIRPWATHGGAPVWELQGNEARVRCAGSRSGSSGAMRVLMYFEPKWGMWAIGPATITWAAVDRSSTDQRYFRGANVTIGAGAVLFDAISTAVNAFEVSHGSWFVAGEGGGHAHFVRAPLLRVQCWDGKQGTLLSERTPAQSRTQTPTLAHTRAPMSILRASQLHVQGAAAAKLAAATVPVQHHSSIVSSGTSSSSSGGGGGGGSSGGGGGSGRTSGSGYEWPTHASTVVSAGVSLILGSVVFLLRKRRDLGKSQMNIAQQGDGAPKHQDYLDIDGALSNLSFDDSTLDFNVQTHAPAAKQMELVERVGSLSQTQVPGIRLAASSTSGEVWPLFAGGKQLGGGIAEAMTKHAVTSAIAAAEGDKLVHSEFEATFDDDDAA